MSRSLISTSSWEANEEKCQFPSHDPKSPVGRGAGKWSQSGLLVKKWQHFPAQANDRSSTGKARCCQTGCSLRQFPLVLTISFSTVWPAHRVLSRIHLPFLPSSVSMWPGVEIAPESTLLDFYQRICLKTILHEEQYTLLRLKLKLNSEFKMRKDMYF